MTHSQINQPKGWGFSRRTPNLNQSVKPNALREVPLNEQPSTKFTSHQIGDVKWLETNIRTLIQSSINLMSRLQSYARVFTAHTISTITSFGYQNTERKYLQERWQKC